MYVAMALLQCVVLSSAETPIEEPEERAWHLYIGLNVGLGAGAIVANGGGYTATVDDGPGLRVSDGLIQVARKSAPDTHSQNLGLRFGIDYHGYRLEGRIGTGCENIFVEACQQRAEGAFGIEAPKSWPLVYTNPWLEIVPAALIGFGYGSMGKFDGYELDIRRYGPYGLLDVRYELRASLLFVQVGVTYRAMLTNKHVYYEGDAMYRIELNYDGLAFSHEVGAELTIGLRI